MFMRVNSSSAPRGSSSSNISGFVDERAHERHALCHTAGELCGIVVSKPFQTDHADHLIHSLGFPVFHAAHIQTERNVLFHREPRKSVGF